MAPQPTEWDQLAASANNGELFLDPAAEAELLAACTEYAAELERIAYDLNQAKYPDGFGDLPSAQYFTDRFLKKIRIGEDSLVGRIKQMYAETLKIRAVCERCFANFRASDAATRIRLTQLGGQVQS